MLQVVYGAADDFAAGFPIGKTVSAYRDDGGGTREGQQPGALGIGQGAGDEFGVAQQSVVIGEVETGGDFGMRGE